MTIQAGCGRLIRTFSKCVLLLPLAGFMAFGGTVSPQLSSMDPNQPVQVIVQYPPSLVGTLLSTVCGVLNLVQVLPGGELCSMTVSSAIALAQNPSVAHVSVNNTLLGAGSVLPVYDYMPQTIQPQNGGAPHPNAGQNIGVAIIDSGINVNQDLIGNGSKSLLGNLFHRFLMPRVLFPARA